MQTETEQSHAETERLKWNVRLLENRPGLIAVIAVAAVLAGLAGLALFRSPSMGLLGFLMILASTADYWLGSNFLVDSRGVQSRVGLSLTAMQWSEVKRVIVEPNAIKLSPLEDGAKMDAFRGVTLRTKPQIHPAVLDLVLSKIPQTTQIHQTEKESPR